MTTIQDIVNFLHAQEDFIVYSKNACAEVISRALQITDSKEGDISFCGYTAVNPKIALSKSKASLLLIDRNISLNNEEINRSGTKAVILCNNARLSFIHTVNHFFSPSPPKAGIHPTALISRSAMIDSNVHIGAFSTIGENVSIGNASVIHSNVHIY